jgi:hypothetical protein
LFNPGWNLKSRPIIIFISAVRKELRSASQLVAKALLWAGYLPYGLEIADNEEGDLLAAIRRKVDASEGLIQLIGQCYGPEPTIPDEQFGRTSYAQYEALYAKSRNKKVWYFLLDTTFETDPHDAEPAEFEALQKAYRHRILRGQHVYHLVGSASELEQAALRIPDEGRLCTFRRRRLFSLPSFSWGSRQLKPDEPKPPLEVGASQREVSEPGKPIQTVFDEDVQFSIFRSGTMSAGIWHTWLAFAYRGPGPDNPDPAEEVERQARAILGSKFEEYSQATQESAAALPRESTIIIVPSVPELEFNPKQRYFVWQEPVHREEFRARALTSSVGETLRGKVTVFLGALVIAEINVKVVVVAADDQITAARLNTVDRARAYRKIFAS